VASQKRQHGLADGAQVLLHALRGFRCITSADRRNDQFMMRVVGRQALRRYGFRLHLHPPRLVSHLSKCAAVIRQQFILRGIENCLMKARVPLLERCHILARFAARQGFIDLDEIVLAGPSRRQRGRLGLDDQPYLATAIRLTRVSP